LTAAGRLTEPTETVALEGLSRNVEIYVDPWGVPHLFAQNEQDLFFAQGFNAARDRLFQIDLWRRRGLGLLSEVFGPAFVEQDTAARLFLYRGDLAAEWRRYGREAETIARAFVAGINAYLGWLEQDPQRMPIEFQQLDYRPARWSPDDVVRIRSHGLTRNLHSEVERARMMCKADLDSDSVRVGLQPDWQVIVPEGLDPCLPADVLKLFDSRPRRARHPGDPGPAGTRVRGGPGGARRSRRDEG
jgi:penicillin amidase